MKPLDQISHLAFTRRFRTLAKAALDLYGLSNARFEFLAVAGNVLFRVYDSTSERPSTPTSPFKPGQYLLRIHDGREQKSAAIRLEMKWLSAIRAEAALPVPEPVKALNGALMVQVSAPGIPERRDCTLLRWLGGRRMGARIQPRHFRSQGEIMAQLHNHAARWSPPVGQAKRRFDYDGLFIDDAGAGLPNRDAWALLPEKNRLAYEAVAEKTGRLMNSLGKRPNVYGLIHGDCGVDANVLFEKGAARILDFDGSGFGYYLYDLSLALEHCWQEAAYPQYSQALLEGYRRFRPLPDEQLRHLNLFRSAFYVYMGLWTVAMDRTHPGSPNKAARHSKWLGHGLKFIEQFLGW